jgi:hypothetical protein
MHARPLKMCGYKQHLAHFHGKTHRPIPVDMELRAGDDRRRRRRHAARKVMKKGK